MDFTFLKEDQIWGDGALDVMKRYGTKVAPTDLTVILGGYMTGGGDRTYEGDLTCASWSASSYVYGDVRCVNCGGVVLWLLPNIREVSARPALPPSEASKISPSEARAIAGIRVAEYGEYPQTVADDETSEKLERLHDSRTLRLSGKNYTFDSVGLTDYDTPFKATSYPEYEMDGKRYIRVLGRPYDGDSKLSTGEQVEEGKPYWVQVQPIEWLMDRSGTMVAKKCLFAGIQFDTKDSYDGDFSKTSIKHYLDTYFAKEMEPTNEYLKAKALEKPQEKDAQNDGPHDHNDSASRHPEQSEGSKDSSVSTFPQNDGSRDQNDTAADKLKNAVEGHVQGGDTYEVADDIKKADDVNITIHAANAKYRTGGR